jgi:gas vesicle protein
MADGYDGFENERGGGSFVIGLLAGTVLGAGLGMLFAPKRGADLRDQISEQAGKVAETASDGYRRASEAAADLADRGRDMYGKARDLVARGTEEAHAAALRTADEARAAVAQGAESARATVASAAEEVRAAVTRGADEAQQYVRDTTAAAAGGVNSGPIRKSGPVRG